jgi:arylsulfatase A-like enzyme
MFTSRMPSETGVYVNLIPIRQSLPTMGEWFVQRGGYDAVYAGKWHLPVCYTPDVRGFNVLTTGVGHQGTISDPLVSSACSAYLASRDKVKPFLMVASFMQPHDICEWLRFNQYNRDDLSYPSIRADLPGLPENFDAIPMEPRRIPEIRTRSEPVSGQWKELHWQYYLWSYYRHIEMVDSEIGRLIHALETTGQLRDTIIVFCSDHGEGMGHHRMVRKGTPYDESARVPFLISYPKEIASGKIKRDLPVSLLDIVPTLCDLTGMPVCQGARGMSLKSMLQGKDRGAREFVPVEVDANRGQVIRTAQYKYVAYKDDPVEMLFDMKKDPGETDNLAVNQKYSNELKAHRKLLKDWIKQLDVAPSLPQAARWPVG